MVKIFTFFVALGATLAGSNGVTLAGSNADSVSCLTVLKVKPEANPQGKPLSMEDANIKSQRMTALFRMALTMP